MQQRSYHTWRNWLQRMLLWSVGCALLFFAGTAAAIVQDGLSDELGKADLAVVFGNTVRRDGVPSARLQARLDRAIDLYRQGWCSGILVSGGLGKEGHNEAVVMRRYVLAQGIPAHHVFADPQGVTTYATARHTAKLLHEQDLHSVIAVSQYYHLPRARLALERFGMQSVYTAHAYFFEWRDLYSIAREVPAWYLYSLRSYDL